MLTIHEFYRAYPTTLVVSSNAAISFSPGDHLELENGEVVSVEPLHPFLDILNYDATFRPGEVFSLQVTQSCGAQHPFLQPGFTLRRAPPRELRGKTLTQAWEEKKCRYCGKP